MLPPLNLCFKPIFCFFPDVDEAAAVVDTLCAAIGRGRENSIARSKYNNYLINIAGRNMMDEAIEPIYSTEHINDSIILFNGCDMELRAPKLIFGKGRIEFLWQPIASVRFILDPIDGTEVFTFLDLVGENAILNVSTSPPISWNVRINEAPIEKISDKPFTGKLGGLVHSGRYNDVLCDEIKFHISNMHDYCGAAVSYLSNPPSRQASRMTLEDDNWKITIDGVKNLKELKEDLWKRGGFAITHVGVLRQRGGRPFKVSEAMEQLTALKFFLSFVEGKWCSPLFLIGTLNAEMVFRDLSAGSSRIGSWNGNWKWSPYEANYLNNAYQGFVSKWKDPKWRVPIAIIIEFYVRANTYTTVELSVLDSFMALDRLASAYDPKIDDKGGRERMISILSKGNLIDQRVPTSLQTQYDSFYMKNNPGKIIDGATILTEFRNGVVHGNRAEVMGNKKNRPKLDDDGDPSNPPVSSEVRIEAKELGLWYVEMALLHLIGYSGKYNDRLTREQGAHLAWKP